MPRMELQPQKETSAPQMVVRSLPDSTIVWVNDGYAKHMGTEPSELIGKRYFDRLQDDEIEFMKERIATNMRGEIPPVMEMPFEHPSGETIYLRWMDTPIFNDAGEVEAIQSCGWDITAERFERKEKEEENLRFAKVVEHLPAGAALIEGERIFMNREAERITGYTNQELPTLDLWSVTLFDDPRVTRMIYRHDRKKGFPEKRIAEITRKDGKRRKLACSGYADNDLEVWLFADVTEEEASNQRFEALLGITPIGIFLTDVEGECEFVNEAWCQFAGISADDAKGQGWVNAIHPEDREQLFANWEEATRIGAPFQDKFRFLRDDGSIVWVESAWVAIRSASGSIEGFIGTTQDITSTLEHKAMQEAHAAELKTKNERLDQLLVASQEANRQKSEFLATMSHEIRTPMNAILGFNALLLQSILNDEQRELASSVSNAGDSLLSIINDILDFSKIDAGQVELEDQEVFLPALVDSVIDLVEEPATAKSLHVSARISEGTPTHVRGDFSRLRQILTNLLSNAVKFTAKGSVSIAIELVEESEWASTLRLSVSDTGIGIPEEVQETIFEPFIQADASTTRRFGGTGLGLVIVTRLVELMNGRMELRSKTGEGSTFEVYIPFMLPDQASNVAPLPLLERRFALIGFDEASRESLSGILEQAGAETHSVDTMQAGEAEIHRGAIAGKPYSAIIVEEEAFRTLGERRTTGVIHTREGSKFELIVAASLNSRSRAAFAGLPSPDLILQMPFRLASTIERIASLYSSESKKARAISAAKQNVPKLDTPLSEAVVLVVEDNPVNQRFATLVLQKHGIGFEVANNGQEALDKIKEYEFDLVLMDVQMPVLDGYDATSEIRRREAIDPNARHLPIVALTANAMPEDLEKCLGSGMDDYLSKPIHPNALVLTVKKWLEIED